jgi:hypothetical protein
MLYIDTQASYVLLKYNEPSLGSLARPLGIVIYVVLPPRPHQQPASRYTYTNDPNVSSITPALFSAVSHQQQKMYT